jgi:putative FmdB family regulatory protein
MPIYEYQCQQCGHQLEVIQKIADAPLSACPACNENKLKKLVSASSFRLKGSGWYETDFKTKNKKQLAESTNVESGGDKSASEKSTGETKTAKTSSADSAKTSSADTAKAATKKE